MVPRPYSKYVANMNAGNETKGEKTMLNTKRIQALAKSGKSVFFIKRASRGWALFTADLYACDTCKGVCGVNVGSIMTFAMKVGAQAEAQRYELVEVTSEEFDLIDGDGGASEDGGAYCSLCHPSNAPAEDEYVAQMRAAGWI